MARPIKPAKYSSNPNSAKLLRVSPNSGQQDFYRGETARKIATEMASHGGLITAEDLANYKVVERTPLTGKYRDYGVITAPPPSAGGVGLLQMMGMLDGTGYASDGPDSAKAVHFEAEAMRRYYADRSAYLGDPDFYNVPVRQLLQPAYLEARRKTIDPAQATPSAAVEPGLPRSLEARIEWHESDQTTHYNVVDKNGNAVAVTYTLNNSYGNGITVPGLGFLLNDEMDDFAAKPGVPNMFGLVGADANAIEPGQTPPLVHDPDHPSEKRQALHGCWCTWWFADHDRRGGSDLRRDRFRHEPAGCR